MRHTFLRGAMVLALGAASLGCESDGDDEGDGQDGTGDGQGGDGADGSSDLDGGLDAGGDAGAGLACDPANDGLDLPEGFCAQLFAEDLGPARHIAITPSGDVYVGRNDAEEREQDGYVVALRDTDKDGVADERKFLGTGAANGVFWAEDRLFVAQNGRVLRYALPDGTLEPSDDPEVVVDGLVDDGDHPYKTVVVKDDLIYVNIGSASNACQEENRALESPGVNPCPELTDRAGVWAFSANQVDQTFADGDQIVKGGRNLNALALDANGQLFGAQNGRDQLHENWPALYTAEDDLRAPAEALYHVDEGDDYGWPYCYYDAQKMSQVLSPEYGGDGNEVGRCASVEDPIASYPAHWAPLGAVFYTGDAFPARYRNGLFLANHGSRFEPTASSTNVPGYNVIFQPFASGEPSGDFEEFAAGFAGEGRPLPDAALARPVGVAVAPDGALFISDDKGGKLWRVVYLGQDDGEGDAGVSDGGAEGSADAGSDAGEDAGAPDAG